MWGKNFQTLTYFRPKFSKTFEPFADNWWKILENVYPKTPEDEFLAVNFALLKKFCIKNFVLKKLC